MSQRRSGHPGRDLTAWAFFVPRDCGLSWLARGR
jgi:hypothetical protein